MPRLSDLTTSIRGVAERGATVGTLTAIDPLVIAEDIWAYLKSSSSDERVDQGDVVLDPSECGAYRVRFEAAAADRRIDEVRAWMAARGMDAFTWWLGASTTPDDLERRVRVRGAVADPTNPTLTPMALDDEPSLAPDGMEVRLISSVEEHRRSLDAGDFRFGVWISGQPAAYALLRPLTVGPPCLVVTTVIPWISGFSAYLPLVRACWDTAVGLGTPGLVAQAGGHLRPILERLGFRSGRPIRLLVDHAGASK